jgi:hypothetical protein
MNYERYTDLIVTADYLEYHFISEGPKGAIPKIIQFRETNNTKIYNLAFGNKKSDGSIDDLAKDDNKDRNKILATVASAVKLFTAEFVNKWVFFSGSTPERTRLYRMAIALNLDELSIDFEIIGILKDMDSYVYVPFQREVNYFGFLIRNKKV